MLTGIRQRDFKRSGRLARLGLSLVELLVVMAIIAVMLSLLLPAIQMVRTSSMRTSCQNNRRNLELAVRQFVDARNRFPAPPADDRASGWAVDILPFTEAANWSNRIRHDAPLSDPRNQEVLSVRPDVFVCPLAEFRMSGYPGIPAADYVMTVDPLSRTRHFRRVAWQLLDASRGSRTPWCLGPEVSSEELESYEHPHPAEGGLSVLAGN